MPIDMQSQPEVKQLTGVKIFEAEQIKLDNGIPVHVINLGEREMNRIEVIAEGGKCDENANLNGGLAISLFKEGSKSHDGKEIANTIDYYGSWLSNNITHHDTSSTMYSLNNNLNEVLPLFSDSIFNPTFPENELRNRKELAINNLSTNAKRVSYVANVEFLKNYYGADSRIGKQTTEEDIKAITRNDLIDFHNTWYHPENMQIIVAGKITQEILSALNKEFGQVPCFGEKRESLSDNTTIEFQPQTIVKHTPNALQSAIIIGQPTKITREHPDYIPLRILITAIGGYFGSRLMANIREDKGYTYGISSYLSGLRNDSYMLTMCQCDNKYIPNVIEEFKKEINIIKNELISENELGRVKSFLISDLAKTLDTPCSIADYYSSVISNRIPHEYFNNQSRITEEITAATLRDMANKYLDVDKMLTVIAGDETHIKL